MEEESLQIIIWGQKSTIPTSVQGNLAALSSFHSNLKEVAIGALLGEMQMTWSDDVLTLCSVCNGSLLGTEHWWTVCPCLRITSVTAAEVLELPSKEGEEEEEEDRAEQTAVEATPSSARRKRKETAQPAASAGSPSPPPTKSKRLRKRTVEEYVAPEATAAVPTTTSSTDEELREAFEAVEQEKELEALEESDLCSLVHMPIHSLPGSSNTASFADPEHAEFEAMDLDAQLDKLEKLSSTPSKAKSKAVEEAIERLKIWQSTELGLDEGMEAINQLMEDLDLLHRQNMAPRPILEMSLGLAKDVLNLHDRYEDLKPTFKTSEFCKATQEVNLADYDKQKAELDQMVAGYKEAKANADKL
ncbi:unnamed protein product [Prunus brigantina]